jgi:hypothetical protein
VVSANTVTPKGLSTSLKVLQTIVGIAVTRGAFNQNVTMVVTQPNLQDIAPGGSLAGLLNFYPVGGLGLGFDISASQSIVPTGAVVVTLRNPAIQPGDQVVIYTAQHRWVVVHHVLRIQKGLVTFFFTGDPDVAVVAPVKQYGYHVYGIKGKVQANGLPTWQSLTPTGPVTYRNIGTDPLNKNDWLIAEMSHSAFSRHFTAAVPWAIYPQPKSRGKVGPAHPLPAGA